MALSGCVGDERVASIPPPVPSAWIESKAPPAAPDLTSYWTRLRDPVLTELTRAAVANNLDIAQAVARVDQAYASLRATKAQYFPILTGNVGAQRYFNIPGSNQVQFPIGGNASWEVDLFGRIGRSVAASRQDFVSADYALGDVQRLLVGQVAQRVISARATAAQLVIARNTLANDDDNLQIAVWRNEAGLASALDVEQARTRRAQSAAAIGPLTSDLATSANAISILIGEPPGRVLALLADHPGEVPDPDPLDGFAPPAAVLRARPDVRSAEATLEADTARIGVARAALLPLVQLTGQINTTSTTIGSVFDHITGGLFGTVTQLIFDGGRARAQYRGAQAVARGSLATWRKVVLTALGEVETAAVTERNAREAIVSTRAAVEAANAAALLGRSQYRNGLIDFVTLLTIEQQLLSARTALVNAQATRATAFVQLAQALGGGWSDSATLALGNEAGQATRRAKP